MSKPDEQTVEQRRKELTFSIFELEQRQISFTKQQKLVLSRQQVLCEQLISAQTQNDTDRIDTLNGRLNELDKAQENLTRTLMTLTFRINELRQQRKDEERPKPLNLPCLDDDSDANGASESPISPFSYIPLVISQKVIPREPKPSASSHEQPENSSTQTTTLSPDLHYVPPPLIHVDSSTTPKTKKTTHSEQKSLDPTILHKVPQPLPSLSPKNTECKHHHQCKHYHHTEKPLRNKHTVSKQHAPSDSKHAHFVTSESSPKKHGPDTLSNSTSLDTKCYTAPSCESPGSLTKTCQIQPELRALFLPPSIKPYFPEEEFSSVLGIDKDAVKQYLTLPSLVGTKQGGSLAADGTDPEVRDVELHLCGQCGDA